MCLAWAMYGLPGSAMASVAGNRPPTGIQFSPALVEENVPAGGLVGSLQAIDPDPGDSHVFELVPGEEDWDNALVAVEGTELHTASEIDFEQHPFLMFRVRATDATGLWVEQAFMVEVQDRNEAPTGLSLSPPWVAEGRTPGSLVGRLYVDDPDHSILFNFTLVGPPVPFTLAGNEVRTTVALDHETGPAYVLTIRATDWGGLWIEESFVVEVLDVNEAPVAVGDDFAGLEDSVLELPASQGVLANDVDPEGGILSTILDQAPIHGTLALDRDGSLRYTPEADFHGQDSFTYSVHDGQHHSGAARVILRIQPVNDPPAFTAFPAFAVRAIEGQRLEIQLAGRDADGDPLAFLASGLPLGATLDVSSGLLAWTPNWRQAGLHVVRVRLSDGQVETVRTLEIAANFNDRDLDGLADTWEDSAGLDSDSRDSDRDGIPDGVELRTEQGTLADTDGDGVLDALDDDSDGDGVLDVEEAGEQPEQPVDTDLDGTSDYLDMDSDGDGVADGQDTCRLDANPDQADLDADGFGDACDTDADGDGLRDIGWQAYDRTFEFAESGQDEAVELLEALEAAVPFDASDLGVLEAPQDPVD